MSGGGSLHLYGNPWTCDCRLEWMTEVADDNRYRLAKEEELVCKTPKKLSGEMVSNILLQNH